MRAENRDKIPNRWRNLTVVVAVAGTIAAIFLEFFGAPQAKDVQEHLWLSMGGAAAAAGYFLIYLWKKE